MVYISIGLFLLFLSSCLGCLLLADSKEAYVAVCKIALCVSALAGAMFVLGGLVNLVP